jgi:hypothetical protein
LASLVGAILIGVGGARWPTSEVDKKILLAAASEAAGVQPPAAVSRQITLAATGSGAQCCQEHDVSSLPAGSISSLLIPNSHTSSMLSPTNLFWSLETSLAIYKTW